MPHIQQENILQLQNQVFENVLNTLQLFLITFYFLSHRPSTRSELPIISPKQTKTLSPHSVFPLTLFKTVPPHSTVQHFIFVPFISVHLYTLRVFQTIYI